MATVNGTPSAPICDKRWDTSSPLHETICHLPGALFHHIISSRKYANATPYRTSFANLSMRSASGETADIRRRAENTKKAVDPESRSTSPLSPTGRRHLLEKKIRIYVSDLICVNELM